MERQVERGPAGGYPVHHDTPALLGREALISDYEAAVTVQEAQA